MIREIEQYFCPRLFLLSCVGEQKEAVILSPVEKRTTGAQLRFWHHREALRLSEKQSFHKPFQQEFS